MNIRLQYLVLIAIAILVFSNCNSNRRPTKQIEGDLYYSFFKFGNFYQQPDSIVKRIEKYIDTVNLEHLDSNEIVELEKFSVLKNEHLLYSPFIDLKLHNDSIIKIYLNNSEYEKIKTFKRMDLIATKKKVRIVANVADLGFGMCYGIKLESVIIIDGNTLMSNKKLKISDYQ